MPCPDTVRLLNAPQNRKQIIQNSRLKPPKKPILVKIYRISLYQRLNIHTKLNVLNCRAVPGLNSNPLHFPVINGSIVELARGEKGLLIWQNNYSHFRTSSRIFVRVEEIHGFVIQY